MTERINQFWRHWVIQGFVPLTLQVCHNEEAGINFMMDRHGYIELGGGD